jgi:hypothetical protein
VAGLVQASAGNSGFNEQHAAKVVLVDRSPINRFTKPGDWFHPVGTTEKAFLALPLAAFFQRGNTGRRKRNHSSGTSRFGGARITFLAKSFVSVWFTTSCGEGPSRVMSSQRSPSASPGRRPSAMATVHSAPSRCSFAEWITRRASSASNGLRIVSGTVGHVASVETSLQRAAGTRQTA